MCSVYVHHVYVSSQHRTNGIIQSVLLILIACLIGILELPFCCTCLEVCRTIQVQILCIPDTTHTYTHTCTHAHTHMRTHVCTHTWFIRAYAHLVYTHVNARVLLHTSRIHEHTRPDPLAFAPLAHSCPCVTHTIHTSKQ